MKPRMTADDVAQLHLGVKKPDSENVEWGSAVTNNWGVAHQSRDTLYNDIGAKVTEQRNAVPNQFERKATAIK